MTYLVALSHASRPPLALQLLRNENGQDSIKYALIVGVFSLLVVAVYPHLMDVVSRKMGGITSILASVAAS